MKTCPNCGHELNDGERYCPACGAMCPADAPLPQDPADGPELQSAPPVSGGEETPVVPAAPAVPESPLYASAQEPTPEAPRPKSKKGIILGAVAAVAVVCVAVGGFLLGRGGGPTGTPAQRFASVLTGGVDQCFDQLDKAVAGQKEALTSGDVVITAQGGGETVAPYLEGSSIGIQMNMGKDSYLLGMDFTFKNTPIVSGILTYEDGVLGLCVPELADNWYTLDLEKYMETYGGGMSVPDMAQLMAPKYPTKAIRAAVDHYLGIFLSAAKDDNVTVETGTYTLALSGEKREGEIYRFQPTAADLEEMFLALADALEHDTLIHDVIDQYPGAYSYTTYYGEELDQEFAEMADTMRKEAAATAQEMVDAGFSWTVAVSRGKLVQTTISTADDLVLIEGSEAGMAMRYEQSGAVLFEGRITDHDLLFCLKDGDWEEFRLSGTYEEKGGKYSGELEMTMGDEGTVTFLFRDVDEKNAMMGSLPYGSYEGRITVAGEEMAVYFDVAKGKDGGSDAVYRFDMPQLSTPEFDINSLVVTLHSTDAPSQITAPTSPRVDVTNYTEEDFTALGEELSNAATGLMFKLMLAMYS